MSKKKKHIQLQRLNIEQDTKEWEDFARFDDYKSASKYLISNINNITSFNDPLSTDVYNYRIVEFSHFSKFVRQLL